MTNGPRVILTPRERMVCHIVRGVIDYEIRTEGQKQAYGMPIMAYKERIIGVECEMAVTKYLNVYWSALTARDHWDVGFTTEVRGTDTPGYRLILHDEDKSGPAILVYAVPPAYFMKGWLEADDGRLREYKSDPSKQNRFAFFVPNHVLRPIEELRTRFVHAPQLGGVTS